MNLVNEKLKHKSFGEGVVTAHDNSYITIRFQQGEKKFVFPDAFDGFLIIEDDTIAQKIEQKVEDAKVAQRDKERLAEQESKKAIGKAKDRNRSVTKEKAYPRANVAFKCNFCDGGRSDQRVGFYGVCSDAQIHYNILKEKHVWCSNEWSDCARYLSGEISRTELDKLYIRYGSVCYESAMLKDWSAYAGVVHHGARQGEPMRLRQVQTNSLCVLTTRSPSTFEKDRFIFAVFLVDETYEGDKHESGFVTTDSKYRIQLSPDEAGELLFWNYHANNSQPEKPLWGSGLHRYLEDEQAVQILLDLIKVKQGTKDEALANEILAYFARINNIDVASVPKKNGALRRK